MSLWEALAVVLAGVAAAGINVVVGSGTLITFPVLLAVGLPPVTANVSNTLGLLPGSLSGAIGYRRELTGQRRLLLRVGVAGALGGLTGAILLLTLPASAFRVIVPVLIIGALVLVVIQPRLARRLAARRSAGVARPGGTPVLWALVLLTGIYGGYFGAAQSIILLAILGLLLDESLHRLNAVKNVLAAVVNAVAAAVFAFTASVDWTAVLLIAGGATVGGVLGARYGRRLSPPVLRAVIVIVGLAAVVQLVV